MAVYALNYYTVDPEYKKPGYRQCISWPDCRLTSILNANSRSFDCRKLRELILSGNYGIMIRCIQSYCRLPWNRDTHWRAAYFYISMKWFAVLTLRFHVWNNHKNHVMGQPRVLNFKLHHSYWISLIKRVGTFFEGRWKLHRISKLRNLVVLVRIDSVHEKIPL